VLAQYEGYRQTKGVKPDSQTPTYAAIKLFIDNWRWQGVPFYIRSGKALAVKTSQIRIRFQPPPHLMFNRRNDGSFTPNTLSICIQPNEGIRLKFEAKVPDSAQETRSVNMDFQYSTAFGEGEIPEAYERLLLDALNGDAALFTRSDEIETLWGIVNPILEGYQTKAAPPIVTYLGGGWGPVEAEELLACDAHVWRVGCTREDG
jgi:glucose-6-phosphate 1-dehydrogenase